MRILILTEYYWPEPIPRGAELAEELQRRGHEVFVLTGYPHYPAGRLYPGHRLGLARWENIRNIPVLRAFEYPYHGNSAIRRMLNYGSFMVSAPLASLRLPRCDVMYVRHPPLTIGVAAWLIAKRQGIPFAYDVQDIWPESAVLSGMVKDGWIVRFMYRLERFVYRRADRIIVVTEGARTNLERKGVPPGKLAVLPNWVDQGLFAQPEPGARELIRRQFGWGDRFVILFAGNLGRVQGLDTVVHAAHQLDGKGALVVLVGDGSDKARLASLAQSLGCEHSLQFLERQPFSHMPNLLAAANAGLVHLKKMEIADYVIPAKTLAYLASGKPIVIGMTGPAADLIRQAQAGIVVSPEDPSQMAQAIQTLANLDETTRHQMGQRGQDYLRNHFSREQIIPRYERLLEDLVKRP
jgi:glycosyltransferase involved in cell wall biosynthesis